MVLKITKLDAARRQLDTAVLLYFNQRDPVSIHVLAAGAHEILSDLAKQAGDSMVLEKSLFALLPEDLAGFARRAARSPQNFFKHANRDSRKMLEFNPEFTGVMLLDAMASYVHITGDEPPTFEAFADWFGMQHPKLFANAPEAKALLERAKVEFANMDRATFLREYLAHANTLRP